MTTSYCETFVFVFLNRLQSSAGRRRTRNVCEIQELQLYKFKSTYRGVLSSSPREQ